MPNLKVSVPISFLALTLSRMAVPPAFAEAAGRCGCAGPVPHSESQGVARLVSRSLSMWASLRRKTGTPLAVPESSPDAHRSDTV